MSDRASFRRVNFFKGTMRDPDAHTTPGAAEVEALAVVRSNIEAQAQSQGRVLPAAQLDRALSVAQRIIRSLPRDQLATIGSNTSLLKVITDQSLAAAPVADANVRSPGAPGEIGAQPQHEHQLARLAESMRAFGGSGSRYTEIGGGQAARDMELQMERSRAEAVKLGMPWALNNPELLRLGPSAIKTLHEAGVRRERFERMTSDKVGFRAAIAVAIAAHAKRNNLTPEETNALFDKINHGAEAVSGGNRTIQRELNEATLKFTTGPDTPDARRELEEAWRRHADTPEKRAAAAAAVGALTKPKELNAQAEAGEESAATRHDVAVTRRDEGVARHTTAIRTNDAGLAGLNAPTATAAATPASTPSAAPKAAAPKPP